MNADALTKLAEPLDRARVKTRPAGGSKPALSYLETHDIIRTANTIFGFGQWGHEVVDLRLLDGVPVTKDGKTGVHVGYVCVVRLTVEGCVPMSGVGFGDAVEYRDAAPVTAHELAAKEAESDALKRALKNFGDQFGLALYDKQAASSGHVTSGHVTTTEPPPQLPSPRLPTKDQEAALLALIAEKGGGVEVAAAAMESARTTENFAEWFDFQMKHWQTQKRPFRAPAGATA